MRVIFYILAIMIFIACEDKSSKKVAHQPWQAEGESEGTRVEGETKTTTENTFKPFQLKPINEASESKDLKKTLDDLLKVIEKKDVEGLKPYIDKNIKIGFGDGGGINDFITMWELNKNPDKSMIWQELRNAITLGGTFDDNNGSSYSTPYVFTSFPDDYDVSEYAAIVGNKVNIRDKPSTKGAVVKQLNYDIIKLLPFDVNGGSLSETIGNETHDWLKIEMSDGKTGYVWGKFCRSAIDYRANFAKVRNEGWKITFFVAGD